MFRVSRLSMLMVVITSLGYAATAPTTAVAAQEPAVAPPASVTRDDFRKRLIETFPMEEAESTGGTLVVGDQSDIDTLNGILSADSPTFYITGSIFETLVGGSPIDGQIVPALAESWEVSDDGITYTFHLSQEAAWHDGVDFTAEDVVFSFDMVLDPNTGSRYASLVNDAVDSYRAVDEDTFEITARDAFVTFLYDAPGTVLIMPKHVWEDVGPESWSVDPGSTGQDPSRVVGTGPFKFKEWVPGDHVTLTRNESHYDVVPNIDEFIYRVLPDENAAVQALKTGETDVLQIIPPAQVEEVESTGNHVVEVYDLLDATFYMYNLDPERTPYFQDQSVRQALFQALDREAITESIFLGYGEVAVGTQPKLSPAYAPDQITTDYPFDPDAARSLLQEAGWSFNDDGIAEKDGDEFEVSLLLVEGSGTVDQLATYMQDAWQDIGVKVKIEVAPGGTVLDRLNARDFEMALLAFSFGPDGSQGLLFSCDAYTTGFNFSRYCNTEYDDLEIAQKREFDAEARKDLLIAQTNIVWDDLPVGPIRFGVGRTGYTTTIHNFYPNGYSFLWSLPYVWIEN